MTTYLLPPLPLLKQWREEEGLSPQEVKARADQWVKAHRIQIVPARPLQEIRRSPQPLLTHLPLPQPIRRPRGRPKKNFNPRPTLREYYLTQTRICRRCGIEKVIGTYYHRARDLVCIICKGNPAMKKDPVTLRRMKEIGLNMLYQACLEKGVTKVAIEYSFSPDSLKKYLPAFPPLSRIQTGKLPDDATLVELCKTHTAKELVKLYGCSRQRVYQRLDPLGIKPLSPTEQRIRDAGGIEALKAMVWKVGCHATQRETGVSHKTLKRMFPDAPSFQGAPGKASPKRKIPQGEALARLYEKYQAAEIARMVGATPGSVRQAIVRAGLHKRLPPYTDKQAGIEVRALAVSLGRPDAMPRFRDFQEASLSRLAGHIDQTGGIQVWAERLGLSLEGINRKKGIRGSIKVPARELERLVRWYGVPTVARQQGVAQTTVYAHLHRAGIRLKGKETG